MNHAHMLNAAFDPLQVVTSIIIAIVASYAALALSAQVGSRSGAARLPWLIGGGLAVGLGIAAGATLIALGTLGLSRTTQFESWPKGLSLGQVGLLVAYAAFMLGVCLLACVVPTRRAVRVEPIVAMRVD